MSTFANADEVYTYIGGIFDRATKEKTFIDATAGTGLVIKLIQTDPDASMLIDFPGQKVLRATRPRAWLPRCSCGCQSDNSNKFWQGKLNFTLAMAQRKVKLDGKRSTALALLPLTGPIFDDVQGHPRRGRPRRTCSSTDGSPFSSPPRNDTAGVNMSDNMTDAEFEAAFAKAEELSIFFREIGPKYDVENTFAYPSIKAFKDSGLGALPVPKAVRRPRR